MKNKVFVIVLSLLLVFCFIAIEAIAQDGICDDPYLDTDGDGIADCYDECPNDPEKIEPEECGCGNPEIPGCGECEDPDMDTDGDGIPDCEDDCPIDPKKVTPGKCGCGNPEDFTMDTDGDRTPDCYDQCPTDPNKIKPGECGCGEPEIPWCTCDDPNTDTDGDGTPDFCGDECPNDPKKIEPGMCGCGKSEDTKIDTDRDGEPDCFDECHTDPNKIDPGMCGCTKPEIEGCIFCEDPFMDTDGDGTPDCDEECPNDPHKIVKGNCGCGKPEDFTTDTDMDGTIDCYDECPNDPNKIVKGECGCGEIEIPGCGMCVDIITDTDGDGTIDCLDECPNDPNKIQEGMCGCGKSEDTQIDTDGDGIPDCDEECHTDPNKIDPGFCGCGKPEDLTDTDGDGIPDCGDKCPYDPNKTWPGICGCGMADADADQDGVPICNDCDDTNIYIYPGAQEICDNMDNDCDGSIDEGLVRDCSNRCGEGTETCVRGQWVNCTAPQPEEEICDGKDNDCDGSVDEGLVQNCSNSCGEGTETCVDGKWIDCTAPDCPECNATRSAPGYSPGFPVTIEIEVNPDALTATYAVEDILPSGWLVSDITEGGTWDPVNKKVKWGPFFDNTSRTLTYNVEAPSDANGCYPLSGSASFDGIDQSICGDLDICTEPGVVMNLSAGWSMISLPLKPDKATLSALFPDAVVMYMFDGGAGYVRVELNDDLEAGRGYWILLNDAQSYPINGELIEEYTLSVNKDGWDMIGGSSREAYATVDNCNIAVIYKYDQIYGYQRVTKSEFLIPGKGYWILFKDVVDQCNFTLKTIVP